MAEQSYAWPEHAVPGTMQVAPAQLRLSEESKGSLLDMWRSVRKRQWPALAFSVVVAVLAAVVVSGMAPVYESTAKVLIDEGKTKVFSVDDLYRAPGQVREHQQTQIEIILSRENALRTARTLKLWEHPLVDPRVDRPDTVTKVLRSIGLSSTTPTREWTDDALAAEAAKFIKLGLSAKAIRGSQLLQVSFSSSQAGLAARVANAAVVQFLQSERAERARFTQDFNMQLQDQLTQLRDKVAQAERALQEYRDSTVVEAGAARDDGRESSVVVGLTRQLLEVRARRLELENTYRIAQSKPLEDYGQIAEVGRDVASAEATRAVLAARSKLRELEATPNVEFVRISRAKAELAELVEVLQQRQREVVSGMNTQYEAARSLEQSIDKALVAAQTEARGTARQQVRDEFKMGLLEREYQSARQFYEQFLNRFRETSAASEFEASVGRMIDPAQPAGVAVAPNKRLIVAAAAVLALLAAAVAAITIDRLDNTVKGGEDAEMRLKQPLLAALPEVAKIENTRMARLYLDDGHSHFAEAIRTARTGVMLSNLDTPRKILLITSTLPGEGKTTIAINLAMAQAQTKRTLLIDCDMRRSQVSRELDLPPGIPGLSNLVAGNMPAEQCIHPVADSPLFVLPVGDMPPNPLELLLSQRFKDTLAKLGEGFETIIIDSPPVELVSDALVLAPMATSIAYVVKAMSTPAPLVRKNLGRVQRAGGNIMGVLVNKLDFKHARTYYGEYGAGNYTYGGYGYGQDRLAYGAQEARQADKARLANGA